MRLIKKIEGVFLLNYRYVEVDIEALRNMPFGFANTHTELARANLNQWRKRI